MSLSSMLKISALGFAVILAACSSEAPIVSGPTPADSLFRSYVSLGNSITAGFQSGGINDSTQRQSYAVLLASGMNTRFAIPALNLPGCPPPVINFLTQARLGGGTSSTCALRDSASITFALNNVAVPGATSFDPFSATTVSSNALTTFILGGKTQTQKAADASPTFFSAWIGNNDVLSAALSGILTPLSGVSSGVTDTATFRVNYAQMAQQLKAIGTIQGGVLIGVVQVTLAPALFPASALFDSTFKAQLDAAAGQTVLIAPSCVGSTSLISVSIISQIASGKHPPIIACLPVPGTSLGDIFVLDPTEQAAINATVTTYNAIIQATAAANGWAYWDPNPTLLAQRNNGCTATVPNLASATQPFGPCFSLDGVHPSGVGQKIIANALARVINNQYKTLLPAIP